MSGMTMSQVRNPQCPPSTPLPDPLLPDTILIEISAQNFQGIFLGVNKHHSWCQEWPCPPYLQSGTLNVLHVPPFLIPLLDTLLIEISTQNFQGIFLGVKKHHSWCQEHPCLPSLQSGTLNVLQVSPFLIPHSWHTSNKDINTKLSGYFPWGKIRRSMTSGMTMSLKSSVRNPQCPVKKVSLCFIGCDPRPTV